MDFQFEYFEDEADEELDLLPPPPTKSETEKPDKPDGQILTATRQNQMLPWAWGQLTRADILDIRNLLKRDPHNASVLELEARLAIASILSTGRKLSQLYPLSTLGRVSHLTKLDVTEGLIWGPRRPTWRLRFGHSLYKAKDSQADSEVGADELGCEQLLDIPVDDLVLKCLREMGIQSPVSRRLFTSNESDLRKAIRTQLNCRLPSDWFRPRKRSRQVESLERYLSYAMTHEYGGNVASALRLTARELRTARVSSQYGDFYVEKAVELSKRAIDPKHPRNGLAQFGQVVSNSRNPNWRQVTNLAAACRRELEASSGDEERTHRALTFQTIALLSFSIGHRNEGELLPSSAAIDQLTGFCRIHEKNRLNGKKARMVWVPDVARKQIEIYERHLFSLKSIPPRSYATIQKHVAEGRLPTIDITGRKVEKLTFQDVWSRLNRDLNLRPALEYNAGRHWLYTELTGACSNETLNAFFGHWHMGCEPWSLGSCLDPLMYRSELDLRLTGLLDRVGWRALGTSGFEV